MRGSQLLLSSGFGNPVRRIVALGDIHGDLRKAETILTASGVVHPRTLAWQSSSKDHHSGLPTKLVQCGDLVHRGREDIQVMDLFLRLRNEATSTGSKNDKDGGVVCLLGNHEEMMAWGSIRYAEASAVEYLEAAGDSGAKSKARVTVAEFTEAIQKLMHPNEKFGKFLRSLPVVHLDAQTVFNHAGLDPSFLKLKNSGLTPSSRVSELNGRANQEWLGARNSPSVLADPVWNRDIYSGAKSGSDTKDLIETLQLLNAERMVVGHTPHQDVISSYAQGKLIAIDVAMSSGMMNRSPEALEILVDEKGISKVTHAITADGSRREISA